MSSRSSKRMPARGIPPDMEELRMSSLAILAQVSAEALLLKSSLAILAQVSAEALLLKSRMSMGGFEPHRATAKKQSDHFGPGWDM